MTDQNEFQLPDDLARFEQQLGRLKPAAHLIDAHEIVFEAGRQSVLQEQTTETVTTTSVQRLAIASAMLGAMTATAATLLLLITTGMLQPSPSATSPDSLTAQSGDGNVEDSEPFVAGDREEEPAEPAYRNITSALSDLDEAGIRHGSGSRTVLTTYGGIFIEPVHCAPGPQGNRPEATTISPVDYLDLLESL